MSKPVLLMLLSRHPYAEKSGRGFMLRQRIEQAQRRFETRIIVVGHAADDESDAGLVFLPMPGPFGFHRFDVYDTATGSSRDAGMMLFGNGVRVIVLPSADVTVLQGS